MKTLNGTWGYLLDAKLFLIGPNEEKQPNFPSWISTDQLALYCYCCCQVPSVMSDSVRPHGWQPTRPPHPWDSPGKNTGVGRHFLLQCMKWKVKVKSLSCVRTLSDPMDCSLPGSSIHGIFQARVLEWGAIAFSVALYSDPFISLLSSIGGWNGLSFLFFGTMTKAR